MRENNRFWTTIEESEEFQTSIRKMKLGNEGEEKVRDAIKRWIHSEGKKAYQTTSSANKKIYQNEKNTAGICSTRIPSPAAKRGKSGGFRVLICYNLENCSAILEDIFKRSELSFGGSKNTMKTKQYNERISSLKRKADEM